MARPRQSQHVVILSSNADLERGRRFTLLSYGKVPAGRSHTRGGSKENRECGEIPQRAQRCKAVVAASATGGSAGKALQPSEAQSEDRPCVIASSARTAPAALSSMGKYYVTTFAAASVRWSVQ